MEDSLLQHPWQAYDLAEFLPLMAGASFPWYIAGGYALELFVGEAYRQHGDLDVLVHRENQLLVQDHFADWELFVGTRPGIRRWEKGEILPEHYWDIWVRKDAHSPWRFQLMWLNTEGEKWLFKRNPDIQGLLEDMYFTSSGGIPYLRPEIQLLYKLTSSTFRAKDQLDLEQVWPKLSPDSQEWVCQQLFVHDPNQLAFLRSLTQHL